MKNINELTNEQPVFMNDWSDRFGVIADFENVYITQSEYESEVSPNSNENYWIEKKSQMKRALERYENINILFASYGNANYTGDAWVLFEQEGKLYEVRGSHCSCYGLEGQWEPEAVLLNELNNRLTNGTFGEDDWSDNNFKQELCKFLGIEYIKNKKY